MHFDFEIIYFASMTMSTVATLFAWLTDDDARLTIDASHRRDRSEDGH